MTVDWLTLGFFRFRTAWWCSRRSFTLILFGFGSFFATFSFYRNFCIVHIAFQLGSTVLEPGNDLKVCFKIENSAKNASFSYLTCVEVNPSCSAITSLSAGVKYFWKLNRFSSSFNWYVVKAVLFFRFFFIWAFWPSIVENSVPDLWKAFLKNELIFWLWGRFFRSKIKLTCK